MGCAQVLTGFDNRGRTYLRDGRIFRLVETDYQPVALRLHELFQRHELDRHGFAETWLADEDDFLFEHRPYSMSFPHEWPGAMFRDAALFHLRLLKLLQSHGLTLKDALPNNVVFDGPNPRFVDFLSIVEIERLPDETWLDAVPTASDDPRRTVLTGMFEDYFLLPLIAHAFGAPDFARELLRGHGCHMTGLRPSDMRFYRSLPRARRPAAWLFLRSCRRAFRLPFPEVYDRLTALISKLRVLDDGGYATYYDSKGENFPLDAKSHWRAKQHSVDRVLIEARPRTVLDIGANTGWFSRLAAAHGAKVFSLDVDESSLNALYSHSRRDGLDILPLRISFGDLEQALDDGGRPAADAIFFSAPIDRVQADLTLMLGLIHHLVLGENRSLASVFETLSRTCRTDAVVEFVDLEDPLVRGNPGYFPSIAAWSADSYNLDRAIHAAKAHFREVEVIPSHPETRRLLHLRR